MADQPVTLRDSVGGKAGAEGSGLPVPGLLLIFSVGEPCCTPIPIPGNVLELGRGDGRTLFPTDPRMSRRHASISFDGERFRVVEHGSQNGTYVDGVRVSGSLHSAMARVLRTGDSLFLFCGDLRPFQKEGVRLRDDRVMGPLLQEVLLQAARAAQYGRTLHITGDSGSGKEGIARTFHGAGPRPTAPFVPINCATIAPGVAERLLFGARRGAFSGAVADTEGLIQSADGGTLFLDEVAELDLSVQAKLLRVIETREVLAMGALRPRPVNLQLCTASHRNLRHEVSSSRFREDLYFRISSPCVIAPPLRQRLEEIPWLVQLALKSIPEPLSASSLFVEQCLLRVWPGNVRELLAEVRAAAQTALGRGVSRVEPFHLAAHAGQPIERIEESAPPCAVLFHPPISRREQPDRIMVEEALRKSEGNISATARALGLHRTQLKRLIVRYGIHASVLGRDQTLDDEDGDS
jgi:transcriptional regulator of acetoin/glycerol metabolism